jgi:hypothetical protein
MNVKKVKLVSFLLTNQPGELERVTRALAEKNINITGIYAEEGAGKSQVHMVSETGEEDIILEQLGIEDIETKEILAINTESKIGTTAGIAAKLSANGVNINSIFGTECPSTNRILFFIDTEDVNEALETLSEN